MNKDELYHYGVKGMKWGVRRARKRARSENVPGRSKYSTGKNYDAVYNRMKEDKKVINDKYQPKYADLIDQYLSARRREDYQKVSIANKKLNEAYYRESFKLAERYKNRFNEASLKDIQYKDVKRGVEYLKRKDKTIFNVEL